MRILIASSVVPDVLSELKEKHDIIAKFRPSTDELKQLIVDREVVILRSGVYLTDEVLALAPNLRLVIRAGSGVDNVDVEYLAAHNIHFARIQEPGARAVAEITFGFMISLARQIRIADTATREGRWIKTEVEGFLLKDKVLGIVGAGNIGRTVAKMANAWDMRVMGCIELYSEATKKAYSELDIDLVKLPELLRASDFVSLHVPLNQTTRNLIGADELAMMKRGAFLINMARGGVVDEEALYQNLITKHIRGCALDVHVREGEGEISLLAGLSNVILTPHMGAQTTDTQTEIGGRILEIIRDIERAINLEQYTVSAQMNQTLSFGDGQILGQH